MGVGELTLNVRNWLEKQGYPLEMRTARSFRNAGFQLIQSDYYMDEEESVQREIDIVAYRHRVLPHAVIRLSFVTECKSCADKPWVLFTGDRGLAAPARVAQRAASHLGRTLLKNFAHDRAVQSLPVFNVPSKPAYAITQAFTQGKDAAYAAVMAACKAVRWQINDADCYTDKGHPYALIALPLVVTDAPLVEASFDRDDSLCVVPVDTGCLVWRNPVMHQLHNVVSVVHIDALDAYLSEIYDGCGYFLDVAEAAIGEILTSGE